MAFLMGLNDNFSHVRGQILLIDLLPPINRVFSLIHQEEKQREVGITSVDPASNLAFAVHGQRNAPQSSPVPDSRSHNSQNSKNRPVCTHCGYTGHTKDRCYKLHGYPPNYKKKQSPTVHNVTLDSDDSSQAPEASPMTLTPQQYQQLIALLQSQVPHSQVSSSVLDHADQDGMVLSSIFSLQHFSSTTWIIDSSATHYYRNGLLPRLKPPICHGSTVVTAPVAFAQ